MIEYWDEMNALERRMDDLIKRFFGPRTRLAYPALPLFVGRPFVPAMDVYTKEGNLIVKVELPGVDPEHDVHVQVEGDELVIRGERKQEHEMKEDSYYRMEASYGAFERRIPLPRPVEAEAFKADFAAGILTVTVREAAAEVEEVEPPAVKEIPITSTATPAKAA